MNRKIKTLFLIVIFVFVGCNDNSNIESNGSFESVKVSTSLTSQTQDESDNFDKVSDPTQISLPTKKEKSLMEKIDSYLGKYELQDRYMSKDDLNEILSVSDLSNGEISNIIDKLSNVYGDGKFGNLKIAGALTTCGFNGSFFIDNDTWDMSILIKDPNTNKIIEIEDIITAHIWQGGLVKLGFGYECTWVFLPAEAKLSQLVNVTYGDEDGDTALGKMFGTDDGGRGIGFNLTGIVGIHIASISAQKGSGGVAGNLIIVSPRIGPKISIGPTFPKIAFKMKKIGDENKDYTERFLDWIND